MINTKSSVAGRPFIFLLIGLVISCLFVSGTASAQKQLSSSAWRSVTIDGKIPAGTKIKVRTTEAIKLSDCDNQTFHGVVDRNVFGNQGGNVLIYRGTDVQLIARCLPDNTVALDVASIAVNGEQFGPENPRVGEERDVVSAETVRSPGIEIITPAAVIDLPGELLITFRLKVPFAVQPS